MSDDARESSRQDDTPGTDTPGTDTGDSGADGFDPTTFDPEDFAGGAFGSDEDADVAIAVQQFWESARPQAGMAKTGVVTGVLASETVPPPAWAFGDDPKIADTLVDLVLEGTKTATSSMAWEYEDSGEPMPTAGELSILLDGSRVPRALIRTTSTQIVPFDEVDEDVAEAEGEDDKSLESWRVEHEKFFRRTMSEEHEFAEDMPVLVERFELLYPT